MKKIYTGVGSRNVPPEIKELLKDIGRYFSLQGWVLRSGGANGCDSAFEEGCDDLDGEKEIYLPWRGFNGNISKRYVVSDEALDIASRHHPKWVYLKDSVKKMHGRNVYQVLGYNLDIPSNLLICWTGDGCETKKDRTEKTGGTGTAISIAETYDIPVINVQNEDFYEKLLKFI